MRSLPVLRALAALLAAGLPAAALSGGPLSICGPATQPSTSNVAVKYPSASVTLTLDQGSLGPLSNAQARSLVASAVALWTNVPTASINVGIAASALPIDVTAANFGTYYNQFSDGVNPVMYDTDGTIVDAILGSGASDSVLGFAGSASYGYPTCAYAEGQAVLSGKLLSSGAITQAVLSNVITHEIGHLIGLDHTQLDGTQGLASSNYPMMYPIAYRTSNSLHEDDAAAVSALYPDTNIGTAYGTLSGTFTTAAGTPVLGANLWAQGTGGTFSIVSDYLAQGTGGFRLELPPGTYTLHAEALQSGFNGGSSVGPYANNGTDLSFQPPLYSGTTPMSPVTLGGASPTQVTITAGCSGTVTFRMDGSGALSGDCNVALPATPSTVSPSGTIATTTPTYTWNAVSGASSYQLLVQNTAGVAVNATVSAAAAGCAGGTGTCSHTPSTALTNGATYNWFVNAANSGGTSAWSAARSVTVSSGSVPAVPTNVSPSGSIGTATPNYAWNASAGAASYGLLVQGPGGTTIDTLYTASAAGCGAGTGTCAVTPGTPLMNGGAYAWSVNATNAAGTSARSATTNFTVSIATASPPAPPTLVSPSGTVTTATPAYTWNASAGAISYYLLVQNTAGVAIATSYGASVAGCGSGTGTCTITPSTALANGSTYSWFVKASNAAGTSAWSAGSAIMVNSPTAAAPPAAPVTISPSGSVATATPTYAWNASPGATSYDLLVQNTMGVAVSMSLGAADAGCASGSGTCAVTPAAALSDGASYNWFVKATNGAGTSAWSAASPISVSAAGPSVPLPPLPVSPTGAVSTTTPTYTWNASASATSYYLLAQNTAAVAVSASVSAASAGCGSGSGVCSFTPSAALSNGATYNWFVNASNSLGSSAWSTPTTITVSATGPSIPLAPILLAPAGSIGTRTPTYSWNASGDATSYYLLVQNTAGVAVGTTVGAAAAGCGSGGVCAFTPPTALAAGTTYRWFVSASNDLGTSPWSAGETITTP